MHQQFSYKIWSRSGAVHLPCYKGRCRQSVCWLRCSSSSFAAEGKPMDDRTLGDLAAQAPCQPVTLAPASIRLATHPGEGAPVQCWWRHGFWGELSTPPQMPHVVAVHLQDAPRFLQRRDGRCLDAPCTRAMPSLSERVNPRSGTGKPLAT